MWYSEIVLQISVNSNECLLDLGHVKTGIDQNGSFQGALDRNKNLLLIV